MRIELDGIQISSNDHSDLSDGEISLRRSTGGSSAQTSFSSNINFYGKAFKYLRDKLITSPTARQTKVKIAVFDTCCEPELKIYEGIINVNTIDFCDVTDGIAEFCTIKTDSTEDSEYVRNFECIRSKLINKNIQWTNGEYFWNRKHPHIRYCENIRPKSLGYLIVIFGFTIMFLYIALIPFITILITLYAIVGTIWGVIAFFFGLGDFEDIDDAASNSLDALNDVFAVLTDYFPKLITGCGYGHTSPFVRDYIYNVCQQCGITNFESSILNNINNEYFLLTYFHAPNDEGFHDWDNQGLKNKYFSVNSPNITGGDLLDKMSEIFNAQWWVEGSTLKFEPNGAPFKVWLDLTNKEDIIINRCYTYSDEPFPLGIDFKYQTDGVEGNGDEALYLFNDVVPFDNPIVSAQKGLESKDFLFSACRCRGDGIDDGDVLDIFGDVLNTIFYLIGAAPLPNSYDNNLILANGKTNSPKLLILEPNFAYDWARVVHKSNSIGSLNFNVPMWFCAAFPAYNPTGRYNEPQNSTKRLDGANLWQFWTSSDPINSPQKKGINFEIELQKNCENFEKLFQKISSPELNFNLMVKFNYVNSVVFGEVEEIQIKQSTMVVRGKI